MSDLPGNRIMNKKNVVTLLLATFCIAASCLFYVLNISSQQATPPPIVTTESVADARLTESMDLQSSADLAALGRLMEQGINPFGYWDEGEGAELRAEQRGAPPARELAVVVDDPTIICTFNQNELDDLLTQLNELFNNMFIVAQAVLGAGVTLQNDDLATLLLNANTPQDVSRTRKVLLEKIDYLRRLSIVLANDIFTVIPPSAEQSAREEAVV